MPCADAPLDIVVFLLDDLRFDQVVHLEETTARLGPDARIFERAYVTTPMCCPERASFLSGGWWPRQTGVRTNDAPFGGATAFWDARTLPTRLQEAGYHTALLGKYLNEYDALGAYVPPGWSTWAATGDAGGWTDFDVYAGSSGPDASEMAVRTPVEGYVADWQAAAAIEVLGREGPHFLYVSFLAPHHPHQPARPDREAFDGYTYRDRGFEEADVSDKPSWIQAIPPLTDEDLATFDANNRERLQSLLAVDRAMAAIVDAVRVSGRADRTVFVLTSDNGQQWREHRADGKGVAYEESVRVPLWIAGGGTTPGATDELVAANLDLAASVQAWAGLSPEGEGRLPPGVCDGDEGGRSSIVLQGWPGESPGWAALVTAEAKYVRTLGGERELYDLVADPYELASLHGTAEPDTLADFDARVDAEVGLVVSTTALAPAVVGEPYEARLSRWGGVAPVTWEIASGRLPAGLLLDGDAIVGMPSEPGYTTFAVRVTDASVSPVHGGPETWTSLLGLEVREAAPAPAEPEGCGGCGGGGGAALLAGLAWGRRRRRPRARAG